jgi:hypothetical protein
MARTVGTSLNYHTTRRHIPDNNTFLTYFNWCYTREVLCSWRHVGNSTVINNPLARLSDWSSYALLLCNRILPSSLCFLIQTSNRNIYRLSIFVELKFALQKFLFPDSEQHSKYVLTIDTYRNKMLALICITMKIQRMSVDTGLLLQHKWPSCSAVGWGTMLQAETSRVGFLMRSLDFSIGLILSVDPLREMSTRNLSGGNGRPTRKANLTAICEPTV